MELERHRRHGIRQGSLTPELCLGSTPAQAAAASRAPDAYRLTLLIIGLATSIPLIIIGSTLLMKIMERFPIIITLGAALLGWLAGEMLVSDPAIAAWFKANLPHADLIVGIGCAILVVVIGKWLHHLGRLAGADATMHNSSN